MQLSNRKIESLAVDEVNKLIDGDELMTVTIIS